MKRLNLTAEQVEEEIRRLEKSPYVKIARDESRLKNRLYALRSLEKRGKEIAAQKGIAVEIKGKGQNASKIAP